jgi:adenylate kinase
MASGVRLLVLGKQGAGKGTQAVRIARHYGVPHISTGDMFRAAAAAGTSFGLRAKEYMKRGELVPDDVVIGVVAERLAKDDAVDDGFVLDGFPRTRVQAEELQRLLGPGGLDAAVDIDVPTDVVIERISGRRVCATCGATYHVSAPPKVGWVCDKDGGDVVQREDDTPEAVTKRLELYDKDTRPLLDFYEGLGLLVTIDGVGDPDNVFDRILDGVETVRQLRLSSPGSSR